MGATRIQDDALNVGCPLRLMFDFEASTGHLLDHRQDVTERVSFAGSDVVGSCRFVHGELARVDQVVDIKIIPHCAAVTENSDFGSGSGSFKQGSDYAETRA